VTARKGIIKRCLSILLIAGMASVGNFAFFSEAHAIGASPPVIVVERVLERQDTSYTSFNIVRSSAGSAETYAVSYETDGFIGGPASITIPDGESQIRLTVKVSPETAVDGTYSELVAVRMSAPTSSNYAVGLGVEVGVAVLITYTVSGGRVSDDGSGSASGGLRTVAAEEDSDTAEDELVDEEEGVEDGDETEGEDVESEEVVAEEDAEETGSETESESEEGNGEQTEAESSTTEDTSEPAASEQNSGIGVPNAGPASGRSSTKESPEDEGGHIAEDTTEAGIVEEIAKEAVQVPEVNIASATHPSEHNWYGEDRVSIEWMQGHKDGDVYWYALSRASSVLDGVLTRQTSRPVWNGRVEDGESHFHIMREREGNMSPMHSFRIAVDTEPPESFDVEVEKDGETRYLVYGTTDEMSGVEYFLVHEEQDGTPLMTSEMQTGKMYLPTMQPGSYVFIVTAIDKAGNTRSSEALVKFKNKDAGAVTTAISEAASVVFAPVKNMVKPMAETVFQPATRAVSGAARAVTRAVASTASTVTKTITEGVKGVLNFLFD